MDEETEARDGAWREKTRRARWLRHTGLCGPDGSRSLPCGRVGAQDGPPFHAPFLDGGGA